MTTGRAPGRRTRVTTGKSPREDDPGDHGKSPRGENPGDHGKSLRGEDPGSCRDLWISGMLRIHGPQPHVLQGLLGILRIPTGGPRIPIPSQNSHLRPGGPFPGPSAGILRPSGAAWSVSLPRTTAPVTVGTATATKTSRAPTVIPGCSS